MAERTIKAGEFKAKCLKLLDEVEATGDTLVITKRGKPVARVAPVAPKRKTQPIGFMKGLLPLADPNDDLFSAWDDEINAAFEEGLETTARLIEEAAPTKRSAKGAKRDRR